MKLELKEVNLLLALLDYSDPTGFFAKQLSEKIREQAKEDFKEDKQEG